MATKKDTGSETTATSTKKPEKYFPVEDYIRNAEAFGYKRYTVVGAMYPLPMDYLLTKSQFKQRVEEFRNKVVK